ncbi:hypothetical protein OG21DRAFT_1605619 [Imleria badia]|nr:hypothetical protein OG21DRAFT_1605619 [Imleria badia]
MFSSSVTLLPIAALVVVAAANDLSQCNDGANYCCNQKLSGSTDFTGVLGGVLNPVVGANVLVRLTCDPVTVIVVGSGAKCATQCAACNDNTFWIPLVLALFLFVRCCFGNLFQASSMALRRDHDAVRLSKLSNQRNIPFTVSIGTVFCRTSGKIYTVTAKSKLQVSPLHKWGWVGFT